MEPPTVVKLDPTREVVAFKEAQLLEDAESKSPVSLHDVTDGVAIPDVNRTTEGTIARSPDSKPDSIGEATLSGADEVPKGLHPYYKAANAIRAQGIDHNIKETDDIAGTDYETFEAELIKAWKVASSLPSAPTVHSLLSTADQHDLCSTIADHANVLFDHTSPNNPKAYSQHYSCVTVELAMGKTQEESYRQAFAQAYPELTGIVVKAEPKFNAGKLAKLASMAIKSDLLKFRDRPKYATKLIHSWYVGQYDRGAAFFHQVTRATDSEPPYLDRRSMALYMSSHAVKIQYLAGLCSFVIHHNKAKLQVIVRGFLEMWYIESFLTTIGFEVIALYIHSSLEEKKRVVSAFQDTSHPSQILISPGYTMVSVNYVDGISCFAVYLEPPSSDASLEHIMKKAFGSDKLKTHVWILTCNHTHDQHLQATSAIKTSVKLATRLSVEAEDLSDEINARRQAGVDLRDLVSTAKEIKGNKIPTWEELEIRIKEDILDKKCRDLYRSFMGQRSDRHGWISMADLEAKDYLPYEAKYEQENPRKELVSSGAGQDRMISSDFEGNYPSKPMST